MNEQMITNFSEDSIVRESFNTLVKTTFELDFSPWYNRGYWQDSYVPFAIQHNGEIIANASINKMDIVINGVAYRGIQIGTVMTAKAHRGKGLAKQLMLEIMKQYEKECDILYLFANDTVLDFYPAFGFERKDETAYTLDLVKHPLSIEVTPTIEQWHISTHQKQLEQFAKQRITNDTFCVMNNDSLWLFYCSVVFTEQIFYIAALDIIVLMEEEDGVLYLFDVVSCKPFVMEEVLAHIVKDTITEVQFFFMPAMFGIEAVVTSDDDDALFIAKGAELLPQNFRFPLTSHC